MFGKRCTICGLYIKAWQRGQHATWHADQVVYILKLLCNHCVSEHGKPHSVCGKASCKCICNAFGVEL